MTWAEAFPNLLIGLREGLEAGLIVSILLAALRRSADGQRASTAPIWLGVLAAVTVAASFAAVITFSTSVISTRAQEAVGGLLSVLAVGLVTMMVFWMRRTAATLAGRLRGEVEQALRMGTGALALTAFLAVGREGLETTLFLWTAVKASGSTLSPLVGAAVGLGLAVLLCWLMFRKAITFNLGTFFSRTALALIVIAAGVLAYGLGDLQDAGLLPGRRWVAFDVSAHIDPGAWWVTLVSGVTELSPTMTVLQVVAWFAYLGVVIPLFVLGQRRPRTAPARATSPATARTADQPDAGPVAVPRRPRLRVPRLSGRRAWVVAGVTVAVPACLAALAIVVLPGSAHSRTTTIEMAADGCAKSWDTARAGNQTFTVHNSSTKAGEINLDNSSGGVVAELETVGPGTSAPMSVSLGSGSYTFRCYLDGAKATSSATVRVSSGAAVAEPAAFTPVSLQDLVAPNHDYEIHVSGLLDQLSSRVAVLRADLEHGDVVQARRDWLGAQLLWERVGASYDSFGDLGEAVDNLPNGLPGGVHDPAFTGLHRVEYGLWHAQRPATLVPVVTALAHAVARVRADLASDAIAGDPTNLPLRAHEILEDALRDHLSGQDDEGSGAEYAETYADLDATRFVLEEVAPLVESRAPGVVPDAQKQMKRLAHDLLATRSGSHWLPPSQVSLARRQAVDGSLGALLETLSAVPDVLEVPVHG